VAVVFAQLKQRRVDVGYRHARASVQLAEKLLRLWCLSHDQVREEYVCRFCTIL